MSHTAPNPANAGTNRARTFQDPLPAAGRGYRFHHIGIPTRERREDEHFLPAIKVWASGFETSLYGVEWLRFAADSPVPQLVQTAPHVAFEVDSVDAAIEGKVVIFPPFAPFAGVRSAMIEENGAPIEMIEFVKP